MSLTKEDLNLWRPEVYDKRFNQHLSKCDTLNEAWEATERDFKRIFGSMKYKDYESFRQSRRYRIKKKNKSSNTT